MHTCNKRHNQTNEQNMARLKKRYYNTYLVPKNSRPQNNKYEEVLCMLDYSNITIKTIRSRRITHVGHV